MNSMILDTSTPLITRHTQGDNASNLRESEWHNKFTLQQDKINNLKYKLSMLQQELQSERD